MSRKWKRFCTVIATFSFLFIFSAAIMAEESLLLCDEDGQVTITVVKNGEQDATVDVKSGEASINSIAVANGTQIQLIGELFGYELIGWEVQNGESWDPVVAPTLALESKTYRPVFKVLPIYCLDVVVNPSSSTNHITVDLANGNSTILNPIEDDIVGVFYEGDLIKIIMKPDQQTQITGYKLEKIGESANQVIKEVTIAAPIYGGEIVEDIVSPESDYLLTIEVLVKATNSGGDTTPPQITTIVVPQEVIKEEIVAEPIIEPIATEPVQEEIAFYEDEVLPQTGGVPAGCYYLLGTGMTGIGVLASLKRKFSKK